jgi:hypothetical protein
VSGKGPGDMNLPAQVAVDYDSVKYFQQYANRSFEIEYLVIVANQFGSRMINVYAYGRELGKTYPTDAELLEQLKARVQKSAKEQSPEQKREPDNEKP